MGKTLLQRRFSAPAAVFAAVTLLIGLPRATVGMTISDTEYMSLPRVAWDNLRSLIVDPPFSPWYRPLDVLVVSGLQTLCGEHLKWHMLFQAAITGLSAALIFMFMRRLTDGRSWLSLGAALAYPFSIGVLETTYLFMHKVILSDLLVLVGIYAYARWLGAASSRKRTGWCALLVVCCLSAPLVRELGGVLPAVVMTAAAARWFFPAEFGSGAVVSRKALAGMACAMLLLVLNAAYASFLPKLLLSGIVEFRSIFDRAAIGLRPPDAPQEPWTAHLIRLDAAGMEMPFRVILFFSPWLTAAAFLALVWSCRASRPRVAVSAVAAFALMAAAIYFPRPSILSVLAAALFMGAFATASFRLSGILAIWFVLPLIPFTVFPVHDSWLKMSALPYGMLAFLWVGNAVPRDAAGARWPVIAVKGMAVLAVLFQFGNLWITYRMFAGAVLAHHRMGDWLRGDPSSEGGVVISNLRQIKDVTDRAGNGMLAYLLPLRLKYPLPGGRSEPFERIRARLSESPGRKVWFVEAEPFGRHGFPAVPTDDLLLREKFHVKIRYGILDPLRVVLPARFWSFGGPTDIRHNYVLSRGCFWGRAETVYRVYEYAGTADRLTAELEKTARQAPDTPYLIEEGYVGYNIILFNDRFYAIRQQDGAFSREKFDEGGYPLSFSAASAGEVKRMIDRAGR